MKSFRERGSAAIASILLLILFVLGLVAVGFLSKDRVGFFNRASLGTASVLPLPQPGAQTLAIVNPGFFQTLSGYDSVLSKYWQFVGSSGTGVYDWQNDQSASWHYVITLGSADACVRQDSVANPLFINPSLFAGKTVKLSGFIRIDTGNAAQGYWKLNVKTGSGWNYNWLPGKTAFVSAGTGWQPAEVVATVPSDAAEISVDGCATGISGAKVNFDSVTLTTVSPDWVQVDNGIVTLYQNGVPHFSSSGQKLTTYQEGTSQFVLGMYHVDFGPNGFAWNLWGPTWESLGFQKSDISHDEVSDVKSASFNFVEPINALGPNTIDNINTDLNYADQTGLKVAVNLTGMAVSAMNNVGGYTLDSFKADIAKIKVHPSVLFYHLFDEDPEAYAQKKGLPPMGETGWATIHDAIKSVDPSHLVVANMVWGNGDNYSGYHSEPGCFSPSFSDFAHFDDYSVQSSARSIRDLADGVKLAAQNCAGPVLIIQQTFKGDQSWMPTVSQLRAQYWASVVDGSAAIVNFIFNRPWFWKPSNPVYHWDDPNAIPVGISPQVNPGLWSEAQNDNQLIQTYKQVLLSPTASDVYHLFAKRDVTTISNPSDSPLRTMLKDNGESGVRYLLALNIDDASMGGGFSFGQQIAGVKSLFDNRDISFDGQTFVDDFENYGVRLYKIGFAAPTPVPTSLQLSAKFAGISSDRGPIVATKVVVQNKVAGGSAHSFQQIFTGSNALTFTWNGTAYQTTVPNLALNSGTTYEVLVKGPSHLQTRVTPSGFTLTSAQLGTTVNLDTTATTIRAGDVMSVLTNPPSDGQDGQLTLEDLTAITYFYTDLSVPLCTAPNIPPNCQNVPAGRDINKDGYITLEDVTLVSNNFTALSVPDDQ